MKFTKFCSETIHISGCINVHICIFAIAIVLHVNIHDYCNHLYFFFFFFSLFSFYLSHHCSCVTPNPYQIQLKISLINQNQNRIKPNKKLMKNPTTKKTSICCQIYRYCRWICHCCCYRFHLASVCEYLGLGYEREMNKIER